MDIFGVLIGAAAVFLAIAARKGYGQLREWSRTALDHERDLLALSVDVQRLRDTLQRIPDAQLLTAAAKAADLLGELSDRLDKIEAKSVETHLAVMDKAEKVAARLQDRERKRASRAQADGDDHTIDDEAEWWARVRAAHPLPGMPSDPAQIGLPLARDPAYDEIES